MFKNWRTVVLYVVATGVLNAGTILTFDLTATGNVGMDHNYGDRVNGNSNAAGSYGTFGSGFTPNVIVDYAGGSGTPQLTRWTDAYGDLTNVLENELDGDDRLTVTLTADPGYMVRLLSFDLGGWPNADYVIPNLFVKGQGGTNLYSASNVTVLGASGTPRHSSFTFAPLSASSLQIYIDLSGLGGNSDNIGIDNIAFDQVVSQNPIPEPGTWMLLAGGLSSLIALRRR